MKQHEPRSTKRTYSVLGALLGIGAPLGFIALRTLLRRTPSRRSLRNELCAERAAYSYMTLATPIVFSAFGAALGRRHDKLRRAHQEIDRLRDEFSAVVAHDLRNPLATLLLQLELLRAEAKDGSVNVRVETLDRLEHTSRRLNNMVTDLLDATRIEAHKLRLDLVPTVLPDALTQLLEGLRLAIGKHTLEIAVEGAPPAVMADPARLEQIVTNLVENAAKYSPDGTSIRVEIRPEHRGVALRVIDHGYGIAADEVPRLFERYFQAAEARRKKSGLGLGLFITKGLVDAHGGTITVESEVDHGSTFSVWLPAGH